MRVNKIKKYKNACYVPEWGDTNSAEYKTTHSFEERMAQELDLSSHERSYYFNTQVEQLEHQLSNQENEILHVKKILLALSSVLSDSQKDQVAKALNFLEDD